MASPPLVAISAGPSSTGASPCQLALKRVRRALRAGTFSVAARLALAGAAYRLAH